MKLVPAGNLSHLVLDKFNFPAGTSLIFNMSS